MRGLILVCCSVLALCAQSGTPPAITGAGYSYPVPISVAPGQVVTLFVQAASQITSPVRATGTPWPTALAGVSVTYTQASPEPAPILEVRPISTCLGTTLSPGKSCGTILAVTVQLPFAMLIPCPLCDIAFAPASIAVAVNGVTGPSFLVQPLLDQVHFLTSCDILTAPAQPGTNTAALRCPPLITHSDGSMVSPANPAQGGEELVVYAVGLGQTNPPLTEGQLVPQAAPAVTSFGIDFNYRPNALPTKPLGPTAYGTPINYPKPVFAGATPGFVGLYQINFIVPDPPGNLAPCYTAMPAPYANVIQSNLTVSVGSPYSFDGAGLCVQPAS